MNETICHFGKHKGLALRDIPSGYLKWCVENINPVPEPKYRFKEDGVTPLSTEDVERMEAKMRDFLSAAEDQLLDRDPT